MYTEHMHPLSIFPSLFYLSPLAPTLLRIAAALVFAQYSYNTYVRREELSRISFIVVGSGRWIPLITAAITALTAIGLFLGLYTQLAALVGALLALKMFVWHRRYPEFFRFSRTLSGLLLIVCISLLLTGAGAWGFDYPL